ncbi:probable pseudouridine-5'-phosphatase isoform X2 [Halyomorpha halys]|uniref:probable pseudouridine-5'-phosphatase isoform X2 n=1 Tax=Halyomorpha halys TaxID=286706 RepID=UPI0034D3226C
MFSAGLGLCTRTKLFYFFRNSSFRPVTHVIFDLDGTILDSETLYELIYNKILKKYGKKFNQEVRTAITGTNEQETSRKMVEMLELPITPAQYWSEIEALCKVHLTNPGIKPGAERLISHLSKEKVPLAIATSGSIKGFEIKSQGRPDLFAHFHHIVHGSSDLEVVHGKPAPDIFLVTAKRFPADPTKLNKPRMSELSLAYRKVTTKITAQNPATHVIFDLDGTLLDTEKAYKETFKQMGREYGVTYDDQLHKEVTGMKTIERCRYIVQKFGLHVSPEEWYQSVKERRLQMFSNSKLKPACSLVQPSVNLVVLVARRFLEVDPEEGIILLLHQTREVQLGEDEYPGFLQQAGTMSFHGGAIHYVLCSFRDSTRRALRDRCSSQSFAAFP